MADEEQKDTKLLVDDEEHIQIKDLNRINTLKDNDLLPIDDGFASINAITFANFLKTVKDKTFKGEGLSYFKQVIKDTIASELASNPNFVANLYSSILSKLINNESSSISSLFSKIQKELIRSISSYSLVKSDKLVIMSDSDELQKTSIPNQLLGIPSDFTIKKKSSKDSYFYSYEYRKEALLVDLKDNKSVTLHCSKDDDDEPVYLDIFLNIHTGSIDNERHIYLKYTDESQKNTAYYLYTSQVRMIAPLYTGWYMQKQSYISGNPVPSFLKI
ncbi:hypothetical protein DB313_06190 (plasmid) [Borrelia turcica IST7]|uniref:DUF685 domain-containing protein n=1 Tax=Borrelia turcica IST7 TaxID=1104446 RepID=A0A386PQK4_9SPIR|nr:DUF685 domain-containing protein [Borrelia turcica]AYE37089.1 hypothetical protein DB313_06190 [Borrelia turcica IST7]